MKKTIALSLFSLAALLAIQSLEAQVTIADWTFETPASTNSIIGAGLTPAAMQSGVMADVGVGTGSASHASSTSAWSIPAGNGSPHSWSANGWANGDYFQFSVSTLGLQNINVSFDQTSSATGPQTFGLFYSVNGGGYTQIGVNQVGGNMVSYPGNYTLIPNASPNPFWNATTATNLYSFSSDLSSILGVNNAALVSFRLIDEAATGATAGTDRVDNFTVTGVAVPEPSIAALTALGCATALLAVRRRFGRH